MKRRQVLVLVALVVLTGAARADWVCGTVPTGPVRRPPAINPVTNKIYVTNDGSSVTVIDGATNDTTIVAVGGSPYSVAVNPVTNKIYVTNYGDRVTIIDGATNDTTTVGVDSSPRAVAVNPVTNRIYVANYYDTSVTVIDGATNATTRVPVGLKPKELAVNPVTNKVYVISQVYNGGVMVIDGATNDTATVVGVTYPSGVAVNSATNKAYVTDLIGNVVVVIDGATNDTTVVPTASFPDKVAVNPVTNKIYVTRLVSSDASVIVIDGATHDTTTVPTGSMPEAVAVNPVTNKVYVPCFNDHNLSVIDAATNTATVLAIGGTPFAVTVNPVTGRAYVANTGGVTVIDGTDNDTAVVAVGASPRAAAVNPVTNRVYVTSTGNGVTVIDGATNGTTTVPVGYLPTKVAVNPVTDQAYVIDLIDNTLTVIDGTTNDTTIVVVGGSPNDVAVNPVTNKIYVVNAGDDNVTVVDGATHDTALVPVGEFPGAVAVNPATNRVYVTNYSSGTVTVIDGATNATTTVTVGSSPSAVAVNPVTNKVYVVHSGYTGTVTVIDGATNATTTVAVGNNPQGVAVNPVTNRVYVANFMSNDVTVIDGATNATTTVAAGTQPRAVAVNPVMNRVYVANFNGGTVTVIDGATNATTTVAAAAGLQTVAVNPVTGKAYVVSNSGASVIVLTPADETSTDILAAFAEGTGYIAASDRPALAGKGVDRLVHDEVLGVWNRAGAANLRMDAAATTGGAGTDSITWAWNWGADSLAWGENFLCAVALPTDGATTNNQGLGSPLTGDLLVRTMYRVLVPPVPVAPANGGLVRDDTPDLVVEPFDGGEEYVFEVYDSEADTLVAKGSSASGSWTVSPALARFATYRWQCRVRTAVGSTGYFAPRWSFEVGSAWTAGWTEVARMPSGAAAVKDGAWLAIDPATQLIYATRGSKTPDFFAYDAMEDSWTTLAPFPEGAEGKPPRKGSRGVVSGDGFLYATKGNNTFGFWKYSIAGDSWYQLTDVPGGASGKKVKGGTDLAYVTVEDVGYVYLLKGYKTEFYRYNTGTGLWETLTSVPYGYKEKWDKGSWLAYDGGANIYAHQAKYYNRTTDNFYMYKYDIAGDSFSELTGMPLWGLHGGRIKKKKAKDGCAGAYYDGGIYALKGGNSQQFFGYDVAGDTWTELDTMPTLGSTGRKKRVKHGADIVSWGGGAFFALKGNKTDECWRYMMPAMAFGTAPERSGVLAGRVGQTPVGLTVAPNPLSSNHATLRYSLPKAGAASISVFDVTGRSVLSRSVVATRTGAVSLDVRDLAAGTYLVRLEAEGYTGTQKLVVQH